GPRFCPYAARFGRIDRGRSDRLRGFGPPRARVGSVSRCLAGWRAVTGFGSRLPVSRGMLGGMAHVTQILAAVQAGGPKAAAGLLPLVYDERRQLAAARLAGEQPGQTLQATALVHEAYLRLVGGDQPRDWHGRAHFIAAAAEAMRRILIENARRNQRDQPAGGRRPRPPPRPPP